METSTISWWVQPVITVGGIFISVLVVVWQIGKQFRNSLHLQRRNAKETLRLEIYREFAERIQESSYSISKTMARIGSFPADLTTQHMMQTKLGMKPVPTKDRAKSFSTEHNTAVMQANSLVFLMEKYEIVIPDFHTFRKHFIEQFQVLGIAFNKFYTIAVKYLPTDVPEKDVKTLGTEVIVPKPPTEEQIDEVESLSSKYQDECVQLLGFIMDLRIELQNHLLGSLFDNKLPQRKPGDAKFNVIQVGVEGKSNALLSEEPMLNSKQADPPTPKGEG